jgi:hypothetical protein
VHLLDVHSPEPLQLPGEVRPPPSTPPDQIFVATSASPRRPSSAADTDASAPPYIGDESTSRIPAPKAASTTSRASDAS